MDDLAELFADAGRVIRTQIVMDRATGRGKGFAFVEMAQEAEAFQAIALYNGHELYNQALIVSEARPGELLPTRAPSLPMPRFREIKHKRRGGANRNHIH
jgi:RNA recognition motif-containing protein